MAIELYRMPESEAVRVGLGAILQSVDQPREGREGIWTVHHVGWMDIGTRCEFSDGTWRVVRREWMPQEHRYRYWAED